MSKLPHLHLRVNCKSYRVQLQTNLGGADAIIGALSGQREDMFKKFMCTWYDTSCCCR